MKTRIGKFKVEVGIALIDGSWQKRVVVITGEYDVHDSASLNELIIKAVDIDIKNTGYELNNVVIHRWALSTNGPGGFLKILKHWIVY